MTLHSIFPGRLLCVRPRRCLRQRRPVSGLNGRLATPFSEHAWQEADQGVSSWPITSRSLGEAGAP